MDEEWIQQEFNALKEYLEQHGEDGEFWLRKAVLLTEIGESGEAEEILQKLIKRMPESADAWYLLGQCCLQRNNLERSLLAFARAARLLDKASEDYSELVDSVLQMEGMPEGGTDFFRTLLSCECHTFIFVVPTEFQRVMMQRYQNMAIALCDLGQEVIYVTCNYQGPELPGHMSGQQLLEQMLRDKEQDGEIVQYHLCMHERAEDVLLRYLGESYPNAVFFVAVPDYCGALLDLCESHAVICDIADDNSDFESAFWTSAERYQCEQVIARMSFAVTVSSATLFCREYLLEHISGTYLIPNGVDQEEILPDREEEPEDISNIPHPRIGYVGAVYQRFDRELLYSLAKARPDWSFVLVGPVADDWVTEKYPNIYLLGGRPHYMLSKYYKSFDAALIPYKDDVKMSLSCDPVKLYEHICCDLPTVTSYMPDTFLGKPLTWHGNTAASVQAELEHILSEKPGLTRLQQSDFLFQNSWLARCAKLIRIAEKRETETDRPEHTLSRLQQKFEEHRGEHLNMERLFALSHAGDRFAVFEQCYTQTVRGEEISFDRDMQERLPELKAGDAALRYMEECRIRPGARVLLIIGYFGHDNFGDELLLDAVLEQIKQRSHICPVAAGLGLAKHTQELHHVPAVCLQDEEIVRQAVLRSDIVLLGPGGLLDDRAGIELRKKLFPRGIYTYLFPLALAKEAKKTLMAAGLGVDAFVTEQAKALVRDIFPGMKYLGVRDEYSRRCLEAIGVKNAQVSPDLAFLYSKDRMDRKTTATKKKILGINLRNIEIAAAQEVAYAALFFLQAGWDIHFIAVQAGVDDRILKLCAQAFWNEGFPDVEKRVRLIVPESPEEVLDAIGETSMLLAMRLHVNVMAWQMSVPSLFLAYDAKVASMAELLGLSAFCIPVNECRADKLQESLSDLWKNREAILPLAAQRTEQLRESAEQEFEQLLGRI